MEKHFPGLMKATIEWFKIYKIPDGKPENQFAFNGEAKSKDFALRIIEEVNQHWQSLIKKDSLTNGISWLVNTDKNFDGYRKYNNIIVSICSINVTIEGCSHKISLNDAEEIVEKAPKKAEPQVTDSIGKIQENLLNIYIITDYYVSYISMKGLEYIYFLFFHHTHFFPYLTKLFFSVNKSFFFPLLHKL